MSSTTGVWYHRDNNNNNNNNNKEYMAVLKNSDKLHLRVIQ